MATTRDELLFVLHPLPAVADQPSKTAAKARVQQHAQQRRRRAEAQARGKSKPAWANFTATIQLPPYAGDHASSQLCTTYQPSDNSTDPFHSTAIGANVGPHLGSVSAIFGDIVTQNFLGESFAPEDICVTRKITRYSDIIQERLVECVHNDMLMYATLSYALSFQCWGTNHMTHARDADSFHLRALQCLRSRLEEPNSQIDTWVLISVYSLAITEGWRDMIAKRRAISDPSALFRGFVGSGQTGHRIHLGALAKLIEISGGWESVDPYVVESFILADKHASFATSRPPMLRPWWDPGPLPDKFKRQLKTENCPRPPMGSELLSQPCHPDTIAALQGCIDYLEFAPALWRSVDMPAELESWLAFRMHALQYRLLWAYHESETSTLGYCVSLTALAALLTCSFGRGMRGGAAWVSKRLSQHLRNLQDEEAHWTSQITTWFLFEGAIALLPGPEKDYCLRNLVVRGFKSTTQVDEVERILATCLYLKERQKTQVYHTLLLIEGYQHKQN